MISKQHLVDNKILYLLTGISMSFFLIKGIDYLTLGSYLPIIVFSGYFLLIVYALQIKPGILLFTIRFWAITLLIWGGVRLLLGVLVLFTEEINENHLREQFDFWGIFITLLAIIIGSYLLMNAKSAIGKTVQSA